MRGRDNSRRPSTNGGGITPAYAGKRHGLRSGPHAVQDHPRVCGEEFRQRLYERDKKGSPPRMRGRVANAVIALIAARITPAYAGKSVRGIRTEAPRGDHPRVCGEENTRKFQNWERRGSPPRMRGRVRSMMREIVSAGITPAYAGKSSFPAALSAPARDHPRVCGEELLVLHTSFLIPGSPPRMRGRVNSGAIHEFRSGITPAYAGKRLNGSLL